LNPLFFLNILYFCDKDLFSFLLPLRSWCSQQIYVMCSPCSCEIMSDLTNPTEEALNQITQSFSRFGRREGFSHDRPNQ